MRKIKSSYTKYENHTHIRTKKGKAWAICVIDQPSELSNMALIRSHSCTSRTLLCRNSNAFFCQASSMILGIVVINSDELVMLPLISQKC
jgi:hypothetical protein